MPYNTKETKRDVKGNPIPQRWNSAIDDYEPADNTVKMINTDVDALPVRSSGLADFTNGSVTVTSTEVEIKASTTAMSGRKQMIVYPPDVGTIYWGKSGVTSANGAPLKAGDAPLIFDFNPTLAIPIYAVNDGTNRTIKVVEMK